MRFDKSEEYAMMCFSDELEENNILMTSNYNVEDYKNIKSLEKYDGYLFVPSYYYFGYYYKYTAHYRLRNEHSPVEYELSKYKIKNIAMNYNINVIDCDNGKLAFTIER